MPTAMGSTAAPAAPGGGPANASAAVPVPAPGAVAAAGRGQGAAAAAGGSTPALSVRDLTLSVNGVATVDGVGFDVAPGEVLALVGESGCGKSITAQAIMRLLPRAVRQERGEVFLGGENISVLPERRMRRIRGTRASMIFQEPQAALDPLATVGSQVAEATGLSGRAAREAVERMLREVGISDPARRMDQYPFELSGGMCQRVMIATALIARPLVLVADEPTTALDVTIQAQILALLRALAAERGTAIVLITHDMGVVADIADRVAVMYAGRIAETGTTDAIFAQPRHPYTALLLAALPRLDDAPKSRLAVIEGRVPTPGEIPVGCRFHTRCPLARDKCRAETPPLRDMGDGHRSACWFAEDVR
ncbi:ABC transporter ATP-binding protein [Roseomonas sp. BN140053]|uniref:ABC transporter ATP-binding protein n=1 Tax=Roseomonas sp. BN140053 TaxID=3391898 RepID=UPI0039ED27DF